jgi:hypothetical protein
MTGEELHSLPVYNGNVKPLTPEVLIMGVSAQCPRWSWRLGGLFGLLLTGLVLAGLLLVPGAAQGLEAQSWVLRDQAGRVWSLTLLEQGDTAYPAGRPDRPDRSLRHAAARSRPAPAATRWHGGCLGAGQLQQRAGAGRREGLTGRFSPIRLGWLGAPAPSRVAPGSGGAAHSRRYSPADGRRGSGGGPTWCLIRQGDSIQLVLASLWVTGFA